MRDIKFRQFDPTLDDFMFFELNNGRVHVTNDDIKSFDNDRKNSPVEQFTGFKDMNNVDVYEGDILIIWMQGDRQTIPYVVEDMCQLYSDNNRDDMYYQITKMEVIGNIHSNPELIDDK